MNLQLSWTTGRTCWLLFFFLLSYLLLPDLLQAAPKRVICVESGPLSYNKRVLQGLYRELFNSRVTLSGFASEQVNSIAPLWKDLSERTKDSAVRFLADGFYTAAWNDVRLAEIIKGIELRLKNKGDVDIILSFGTKASLALSKLKTDVAIIAVGVTNAVQAGVVPSAQDSGQNNLVAVLEPDRYKQQLLYFHRIVPFHRLGIVYEDTPTGRSIISLSEIEAAARELGIELVRCHAPMQDENAWEVTRSLESCYRDIIRRGADAAYLTYNVFLTQEQTRQFLSPLLSAGIPTFSQVGEEEVKWGAMACFMDGGLEEGRFAGKLLLDITNGASPRSLSQVFISPRFLVVNVRTASILGWNPPMDQLLSIDKAFD